MARRPMPDLDADDDPIGDGDAGSVSDEEAIPEEETAPAPAARPEIILKLGKRPAPSIADEDDPLDQVGPRPKKQRKPYKKLSAAEKSEILTKWATGQYSRSALATEYDSSQPKIREIVKDVPRDQAPQPQPNAHRKPPKRLSAAEKSEVHTKWATNQYNSQALATEYDVTERTIKNIVNSWTEPQPNAHKKPPKTLSAAEKSEVHTKWATGQYKSQALATEYDVTERTIRNIVNSSTALESEAELATLHPDLLASLTEEQRRVMALYNGPQQPTFAELAEQLDRLQPPGRQLGTEHYRRVVRSYEDAVDEWRWRTCFGSYEALEALARSRQLPDSTPPAPRDYEAVPHEILRHMAHQRNLPIGNHYSETLLHLMQDDAQQGIPPLRPRALDVWSRNPITHHPVDLRTLAAKNRKLLKDHRSAQNHHPTEDPEPLDPDTDLKRNTKTWFVQTFHLNTLGQLPRPIRIANSYSMAPGPMLRQQIIQYLNAREGFDPPTYTSAGNTRLHNMTVAQLQEEAARSGIKIPNTVLKAKASEDDTQEEAAKTRADVIREYLISEGALSEHVETLNRDELDGILAASIDLQSVQGANTIHTARDTSEIARSHTGRLVGPRPAYRMLEDFTQRSMFPGYASTRGLYCATDALTQGFNATRAMYERHPTPLTFDEVMELRFQHWNRQTQTVDGSNTALTPEFDRFVRHHLQLNGITPDNPLFNREFGILTTINMGHVGQVYVSLMFLQDVVRRRYGESATYALGVVTATPGHNPLGERHASQVYTLGDVSDSPRMVFVHNDNAEEQGIAAMGHWSPFVQYGENVELVDSWGLHRLGAAELPSARLRDHPRDGPLWMQLRSNLSDDRRLDLEDNRDHGRLRARRAKCLNCQLQNCSCSLSGIVKKSRGVNDSCARCTTLEIDCEWDEGVALLRTDITGSDLLLDPTLGQRHDVMDPDWDTICEDVESCKVTPKVPKGKPYALHIGSTRVSSKATAEYFNTLVGRLPLIRMRVSNYLNSPSALANPPIPEARRPGGHDQQGQPHWPLQFYGMITQRRGILPWPATRSNGLVDPYLIGLIELLDSYEDVQVQLPEEILITTTGIAGATVPVSGFGNFRGFLGRLRGIDNIRGSSLASKTDLMSIITKHAHHGFPHSIPAAIRPFFQLEHGKYLLRNNLLFLVQRYHQQEFANASSTNVPIAFNGSQALATRLDAHLLLLDDEAAWRKHWLSGTSTPTDLMMKDRNVGRNSKWTF